MAWVCVGCGCCVSQDGHLHGFAAETAGELFDRGKELFPQPDAGKRVWRQELQLTVFEAMAAGGTDEGLERGFAELALECLLHLVPELIAHQRHNRQNPER